QGEWRRTPSSSSRRACCFFSWGPSPRFYARAAFTASFLLVMRAEPFLNDDRVVVIGASAGGIEALLDLIPELPQNSPAPICVVPRPPAESPSLLAEILGRRSKMTVAEASHGARLEKGHVYVAQPDRHLIIENDGTLCVPRGPRENRHRPAVDPL